MKARKYEMKTFKFYGVYGNCYKLDDVIWEALEDEYDGYRSYLDKVIKSDVKIESNFSTPTLIFQSEPLATVKVEKSKKFEDGYCLVDISDGHIWLDFGTADLDDYYPCFRFEYNLKIDEWLSFIN